ncbi:MAG: HAD-IIIC family phosphatase [bacterium]|nr:HAD-IIIC family phosphatase [bacterium]
MAEAAAAPVVVTLERHLLALSELRTLSTSVDCPATLLPFIVDETRQEPTHCLAQTHHMIPQQLQLMALVHEVDRAPTPAAYAEAAKQLRKLGRDMSAVRVALLASITIDPLVPYLEVEAARRGRLANIHIGPFNNVATELLDPSSGTARFRPEIIFIAQLLEDLSPALAEAYLSLESQEIEACMKQVVADVLEPIRRFRSTSPAVVVVHGFAQRPFPLLGILEPRASSSQSAMIRRLNSWLGEQLAAQTEVYFLDFDRVCADVGYRRWRNETTWYLGRAALAPETLRELAVVQSAFIRAALATSAKCLVLDLDNTLWGGILGEDGGDGIRIGDEYPGSAFRDFQKTILELHRQGVILAINSKNNPEDAEETLRSHPGMLLRPEHFAASRINWRDKAENMVGLAEELGIGLESMVFFDDNPAERQLMRQLLPQVVTLEVPPHPTGYIPCLLGSRCFDKLSLTAEDRRRGEMYRTQRERRELKRAVATLEEYYHDLEMIATISQLDDSGYQRAHSLIHKTNQFNLTVRRHSQTRLRAFMEDSDTAVFSLSLSDRFGDNGMVGLAIVEAEGDAAVIDTFILSCRVIGRTVETALLASLVEWARKRGASRLLGVTVPAEKNRSFISLYREHGFRLVDESNAEGLWELDLEAVAFPSPSYIHLRHATSR